MKIRQATIDDLTKIHKIEKAVEKEDAATIGTLTDRLNMFPDGFLLAEDHEIVGYVESCRWDKTRFETFNEIRNFPANHSMKGKTLYVMYLAVSETHRRKGIGSKLIKALEAYAKKKKLEKLQLVALEGFLVDFYKKIGFKVIRELPNFLPHSRGTLMEKIL